MAYSIKAATGVKRIGSGVPGEWKVVFIGLGPKATEATAYYTDDYKDACDTQIRMLEELKLAQTK